MCRMKNKKEIRQEIAILDYRVAWAEMRGKQHQARIDRNRKQHWERILAELQATTKLVDTNSVVESNIYL